MIGFSTLNNSDKWSVYLEPDRSVSTIPSAQAEFYYFLTEAGARHFGAVVGGLGHSWILRKPESELHRSELAWRMATERAAHDAWCMYPDVAKQKREIPRLASKRYRQLMYP